MAERVDMLFYFLCTVSTIVGLLISAAIIFFAVRYRQRPGDETKPYKGVGISHQDMQRMEVLWIGAPLVVFLIIFWWAAQIFAATQTPPDNAMQIYVVGKQWMWKTQHISGRREINELHVPVGQPVKLTMTSEDVIHSFYIPAFRVKTDVLPGRYTTLWFEATEVGEFHLFCAEYCGTKHSEMIGKVVVMEPKAFETWLGGGKGGSLAEAGEKEFTSLGCNTCHNDKDNARGPQLKGLFGKHVQLNGGHKVLVDESYLRESILDPAKKVVAGYQPIMPSYVAQLNEEKVIELIAYIRSLGASGKEPELAPTASASAAATAPEPGTGGAGGNQAEDGASADGGASADDKAAGGGKPTQGAGGAAAGDAAAGGQKPSKDTGKGGEGFAP